MDQEKRVQRIIIDQALLDQTTKRAREAPRLRINHNFHTDLDEPINRLLNAMEPGTYLRPHRHLHHTKKEIFLLLRGRVALFLFDEQGGVTEHMILDPLQGMYGAEIDVGVWHGLVVLESGSVIYEIKEGPFIPLTPDEMAPWAPPVEDLEGAHRYIDTLKQQLKISETIR